MFDYLNTAKNTVYLKTNIVWAPSCLQFACRHLHKKCKHEKNVTNELDSVWFIHTFDIVATIKTLRAHFFVRKNRCEKNCVDKQRRSKYQAHACNKCVYSTSMINDCNIFNANYEIQFWKERVCIRFAFFPTSPFSIPFLVRKLAIEIMYYACMRSGVILREY